MSEEGKKEREREGGKREEETKGGRRKIGKEEYRKIYNRRGKGGGGEEGKKEEKRVEKEGEE